MALERRTRSSAAVRGKRKPRGDLDLLVPGLIAVALIGVGVVALLRTTTVMSAGAEPDLTRDIVLAGSTTVGTDLAPDLLKSYAATLKLRPGSSIRWTPPPAVLARFAPLLATKVLPKDCDAATRPKDMQMIPVAGGDARAPQLLAVYSFGSGCAPPMIERGFANVGMMSRVIKATDEEERFAASGPWRDVGRNAANSGASHERVIGLDALVIVANPRGRPRELSRSDLKAIFAGTRQTWTDTGQTPVVRVVREPSSGTRDTFDELIMGDSKLGPALERDSNQALIDTVRSTPGAIGYVGFGFAAEHKDLAVPIEECGLVYRPVGEGARAMIATEDYPLARRLYLYTPGKVAGAANAINFAEFVTGGEGQKVVDRHFISLEIAPRASVGASAEVRRQAAAIANGLPSQAAAYRRLVDGGARQLGTTIRFANREYQLDERAIDDITRIVAFMRRPENRGHRLIAAGFTSVTSVAVPPDDLFLARQRAESVASNLRARGLVVESRAFGRTAPVGCQSRNDKPGQAKNRRVELWIE